jgi:TolB-like protein/Tfp pilus assembly protein PilF
MAGVSESRATLPAHKIREQASKILQTPDFADFPRTHAFLSFVIEETLSGRASELKEAIIGVEVFGREPGYDCKADSVVRTQARRVREKLGEYYHSAGKADAIRIEIPKGTYVPEFHEVEASPQPSHTRVFPIWQMILIAVILVIGGILFERRYRSPAIEMRLPAIAVLPFMDLDPGHHLEALANGLAEDLERDLSRSKQLRVHASPPANLTADQRSDYRTLSHRLGVDVLLDGQIVTSDGHSEIRVSLVRAADNSLLWTDHFPSTDNAGTIERKIEGEVASALGVKLTAASAHIENPKAHDLFFAGRTLWATREAAKTRQAIDLFQQAIQIDPNDALAYMGIADAYGLMLAHGQIDTKTGVERGEQAARKSLELDPSLAEAHAALGLLKCSQWNWKEGDVEYQRAIELNPSYDRAYARDGVVRFMMGDFPAAERLLRESERLNPYAMSLPLIRAEIYYYWRHYDDSENLIQEVLKAEPKNPTAYQLLARDLLEQHHPERALEAIRIPVSQYPNASVYQGELAAYLRDTGRDAEAARMLENVLHPRGSEALDPWGISMMYARMGDKENTLKWLERAFAERIPDLPSMRWDPALDLVRNEPRYRAIVEKIYGKTF